MKAGDTMKLIASDLDGTLLNAEGEISPENKAAIEKAKEHGIEFIVATGRSYDAAKKPLEAAGISCPIIALNGAAAFQGEHIIREIPMKATIAREILKVCRARGMYLEFFTNYGIYSISREYFLEVLVDIMKSANPNVQDEDVRKKAELRFQMEPVQFIDDYNEIFSVPGVKVYKILGFSLDKEKLKEVHHQLYNDGELAITSSGDINIEFNHPDAQKGVAVKQFAERMGIGMEDVMAVGDNMNDKSMLEAAGYSVAMGNAIQEIKDICRYETKTNEEHGIAHAIRDMLEYS